jgi:hypothetical protein
MLEGTGRGAPYHGARVIGPGSRAAARAVCGLPAAPAPPASPAPGRPRPPNRGQPWPPPPGPHAPVRTQEGGALGRVCAQARAGVLCVVAVRGHRLCPHLLIVPQRSVRQRPPEVGLAILSIRPGERAGGQRGKNGAQARDPARLSAARLAGKECVCPVLPAGRHPAVAPRITDVLCCAALRCAALCCSALTLWLCCTTRWLRRTPPGRGRTSPD